MKPDTKTAHTPTPGPWNVIRSKMATDGAFDYAVSAEGVPVIAEAFGRDANGGWPDAEANARLIAAAPDMRTFLDHDQWQVIDRAIERYIVGEISDLHALGLVTAGFLKLDADRKSVAAKAEGQS